MPSDRRTFSPRANRPTKRIPLLFRWSLSLTVCPTTFPQYWISFCKRASRQATSIHATKRYTTILWVHSPYVHATPTRIRAYVYICYTRICVYVPRGIYRRRLRSLYDTFVRVDTVYKPFAKSFYALSPRSYAMTSTTILRISISLDNRIAQ